LEKGCRIANIYMSAPARADPGGGDPGPLFGSPFFFHHGTPGSTSMVQDFEPLLEFGTSFRHGRRVRVNGSSSGLERSRRRLSLSADVTTVLDFFSSAGQYAAMGWSGAGPRVGLRRT